jgi:RNA polymerase sigma-70 factor (ECF subfamily)
MASAAHDARARLLAELAAGPARRGYAVAYDLLGNRAEAEEAVQEALATACEQLGDLRDPAAAPGWFLRIVTTQCLRVLRRRRLKRRLFGWWAKASEAGDAPATEPGRQAGSPPAVDEIGARVHAAADAPAGDAMIHGEALRALMARLDGLPAQQRAALILRYGHELPVPEVAAMLGVELATAKTHLVRGLARLRDLMEEHR